MTVLSTTGSAYGAQMNDIPDVLWKWLRMDLSDEEFEEVVYSSDSSMSEKVKKLYAELRVLDFDARGEVDDVKRRLINELPRTCFCPLFRDRQWLGIWKTTFPDVFLPLFEIVAERSPWLRLARCKPNEHWWYFAFDTDDDAWFLERLDAEVSNHILCGGEWPTTFDDFENVWPDDGKPRKRIPPPGFSVGVAMQLLGGGTRFGPRSS